MGNIAGYVSLPAAVARSDRCDKAGLKYARSARSGTLFSQPL